MRKQSTQSGMTLVETLVGLVILVLMAVVSLQLISSSNRLFSQADRMEAEVSNAAVAAFVKNQLTSAAPFVERVVGGRPVILFSGAPDSITFVSAEPVAAEAPSEQLTRLFLVGHELIVERTPMAQGLPPRRRVLMRNVKKFSVRYAGATDNGALAVANTWNGRSTLPTLIELTITSDQPGPVSAIRLAVRPAVSSAW